MKSNTGFRGWFYFRMGWSTYFVFFLAAINTLTVTYFLAIDNYPSLKSVFPSFEQYVVITVCIGIPLLIGVGYAHYKKTMAYKSEMDVLIESNPFLRRNTVNADVNIRFSLKLIELILKLSKNTISEKEFNDIKKFHGEIFELIKNRSLNDNLDIDYINEKLRKKSNDIL